MYPHTFCGNDIALTTAETILSLYSSETGVWPFFKSQIGKINRNRFNTNPLKTFTRANGRTSIHGYIHISPLCGLYEPGDVTTYTNQAGLLGKTLFSEFLHRPISKFTPISRTRAGVKKRHSSGTTTIFSHVISPYRLLKIY